MVATFEPRQEYRVIGTRPIRHDGYDKVTGRAIYGADVKMPGLIWADVLRSPHAHAAVKSVDTSEAEAMPGVLAVAINADLPQLEGGVVDLGEGSVNFKWASDNILASDKVLYAGHVVAAVAAVDRNTAAEAIKRIKVEYEVLPSATNVDAALAEDAPVLLADLEGNDLGEKITDTNMAAHNRHEFGDPEKGFEESTLVVEQEFKLQMVHQGYIEPHNATAFWDEDDRIRIWTSTQGAFPVRTQTAGLLNIDQSRVKVTPLEIGGGFGGKIPVYLEPIAAILSRKSGRPVKMIMERKNVFEGSGPAPGGKVRVKLGVNDAGKIIAGTTDIYFEAGAYPGSAVGAAEQCVFACYDIPNTRIDSYDVVVNKPKSAAYRAPGSPQVALAIESVVDEICETKGWDKIEFRLANAAREGTRRADGPIFPRIGLIETLEAAKNSSHWNSPLDSDPGSGRKRGRGIASAYWFNVGLKSAVNLNVNEDGSVSLI